jgi:hypothetical protein
MNTGRNQRSEKSGTMAVKTMKTIQLAVRIPRSTYELVKQNAGGDRAFGAYINQALLAYTNQPLTITRTVLEALREAGVLEMPHEESLVSQKS